MSYRHGTFLFVVTPRRTANNPENSEEVSQTAYVMIKDLYQRHNCYGFFNDPLPPDDSLSSPNIYPGGLFSHHSKPNVFHAHCDYIGQYKRQ